MGIKIEKGYIHALIAVCIWTGFILVSRAGGISMLLPTDIMAIRYLTCASVLLPIWFFKYRFNILNPKLIMCSLIGGLAYALCAFKGFELAPASHAAILLPGLMPLFIIVLSYFINGEKHHSFKWWGVLIITLGIGSLFGGEFKENGLASGGYGWLIAASVFWSIFSVLVSRWKISPWEATVGLAVITCLFYLPVYILWLPKYISIAVLPDIWKDVVLQIFYQGILATIIQMIFYVKAVQSIGPSSMGTMMAMVPILAGLSACVIFSEPLSISLMTGLVLVSSGAWISNLRGKI